MVVAHIVDIAGGRIHIILGAKHCLVFFLFASPGVALVALTQWGQSPKPHPNYRKLQCVLTMNTLYDNII